MKLEHATDKALLSELAEKATMAQSIVNDINNMLTGTMGYCQLIQMKLKQDIKSIEEGQTSSTDIWSHKKEDPEVEKQRRNETLLQIKKEQNFIVAFNQIVQASADMAERNRTLAEFGREQTSGRASRSTMEQLEVLNETLIDHSTEISNKFESIRRIFNAVRSRIDDKYSGNISGIHASLEGIGAKCRQFKLLAEQGTVRMDEDPETVELLDAAQRAVELVVLTIPDNKKISITIKDGSEDVDAVLPRQLLMHTLIDLLTEARERAEKATKDVHIEVSLARATAGVTLEPGEYAQIEVTDMGTALLKDTDAGHAIDIARQFARACGGDLFITSSRGQGNTVTLYLPLKAS